MIKEGKYEIQVSGGVTFNKSILTKESNNESVNLQRSQSPIAQQWQLKESSGQNSTFNLLTVDPSLPKNKFLSCKPDGAMVDLYDKDDGSGRQQWSIISLPGATDTYYLMIVRGLSTDKRYMSCSSEGDRVDLYNKDDRSGRQRWVLKRVEE